MTDVLQQRAANPAVFSTTKISRGTRGASAPLRSIRTSRGELTIQRHEGIAEELQNHETGVEQRWHFSRRPQGVGDLEVKVQVTGQRFVGSTASGLHFVDEATGLGLRYGHGTWVGAEGSRTEIPAVFEAGQVVLKVPGAVLEASTYPAVLDPLISPELGVDKPLLRATSLTPRVASIGANTFLVVWSYGDGFGLHESRVYGTRIDTSGKILDPIGFAIGPAKGDQLVPDLACGKGTCLVAWAKKGTVGYAIEGVRVTDSGAVLDAAPIQLAPTAGSKVYGPAVAFIGTNYLVVWSSGSVQGVRVSLSGSVLDKATITISPSAGVYPVIAHGSSEYLVAWRAGAGLDVVAARVAVDGKVLDPTGILLAKPNLKEYLPRPGVSFGNGSYLVTWAVNDKTASTYAIRAKRVSPGGQVLDKTAIGISVHNSQPRHAPAQAFDGVNHVVTWTRDDLVTYTSALFAARVTPGGKVLDPAGIKTMEYAWGGDIACGGGVCLAVSRGKGARLSSAGVLLDKVPLQLAWEANLQIEPAVASNGKNYLVVWNDLRKPSGVYATSGIYGARMGLDGKMLDPGGILIRNASSVSNPPTVASDGNDYMVAWKLFGVGVEGARVSGSGKLLDSKPLRPSGYANNISSPAIASNGTNYLVVWGALVNKTSEVHGRRVSSAGVIHGSAPFVLRKQASSPAAASNGTDFLVVWGHYGTSSNKIAEGVRLDGAGTILDSSPITIAPMSTSLAVASDGTDYLVYTGPQAARVSSKGVLLDTKPIAIAAFGGMRNAVSHDGDNYLVLWRPAPQGTEIRTARITSAGAVLDPGGFVVTSGLTLSGDPWPIGPWPISNLASDGAGRTLVVYRRLLVQNPIGADRIRARLVTFKAGADGFPCAAAKACQSGFCVDGVCCKTACGAGLKTDCQACSTAAGAAANGTCGPVAKGRVCRTLAGQCDVAETCDGASTVCAADAFKAKGSVCRATYGDCDVAETCVGATKACPADLYAADGVACAGGGGSCKAGLCILKQDAGPPDAGGGDFGPLDAGADLAADALPDTIAPDGPPDAVVDTATDLPVDGPADTSTADQGTDHVVDASKDVTSRADGATIVSSGSGCSCELGPNSPGEPPYLAVFLLCLIAVVSAQRRASQSAVQTVERTHRGPGAGERAT